MGGRIMGTHTPGPWTTDGFQIYAGGRSIAILSTAGGDRAANARLMGTALMMFDALKAVEKEMSISGEAAELVRAAIKKAEGGS